MYRYFDLNFCFNMFLNYCKVYCCRCAP